jgi:enamine deaminase RidA (YjgF/YER057c/UK114 family)
MYGQISAERVSPMQMKKMLLFTVLLSSLTGGVDRKDKQSKNGARKEISGQRNFELLIPNNMPKSVGYSQVATVTGGTIVFVSGQVAFDKLGNGKG